MTETIQKTDKTGQNQDQTLFDDLERRYGPAMAQEIIDQLKKAENLKKSVSSPVEYIAVKALTLITEHEPFVLLIFFSLGDIVFW